MCALFHLQERDHVNSKLEKFVKKKEAAQAADPPDTTLINELNEQIETLQDNITYVQDNIADCQGYIVQYEETKVRLIDLAGRTQLLCFCIDW